MGYGTLNAIGRLSSLLFLAVIVLGINVGKTHPTEIFVSSVFLLVLGLPMFGYGMYTIQKFRDVFDYEPITFWGKQRNGKFARQTLMAFISIGMWCAIAGTVLLLLRR